MSFKGYCEECERGLGDLLAKEVVEDGVKVTFECTECGHQWSTFL